MVTISITAEAYAAISATLPKGRAPNPPRSDGRGGFLIVLDRAMVDRLGALRQPGESYSDVIVRLAEPEIIIGGGCSQQGKQNAR